VLGSHISISISIIFIFRYKHKTKITKNSHTIGGLPEKPYSSLTGGPSKKNKFTYSHNTLDHKSSIDHVFVHKDLVPLITEYKVLLDATNCSDHLPVQVCLSFNCNDCHTSVCSTIGSLFNMYIDGTKVYLQSYYVNSGNMLSKICQQFTCMNYESSGRPSSGSVLNFRNMQSTSTSTN